MSAMQRSIEPAIWQFDGFLDSGDCRALSALARLPRWAEERPDGRREWLHPASAPRPGGGS